MAQEIVFYHSAMQGAPSSTLNAAGAAIAVLDACLVDGFNVNSVSTLTQTGGVATATTSGTNGFAIGDWVEVAGATPTAYNGRVKVTGKPGANQFTYAIDAGTASPASGTMTAKYPGAGWLKTAGGTNIAAYQAGAGSLGLWTQVEDNNPYGDAHAGMRVRLAQGWTALDTATVLGTQVNTHKATGGWMVIADRKTAYCFFGPFGGTVKSFHFGELTPFYVGDAFSAFISSGRNNGPTSFYDEAASSPGSDYVGSNFPTANGGSLDPGQSAYHLRGISQVGGSVAASAIMMPGTNHGFGGAGYAFRAQNLLVPSLADNSLPVSPIFNVENGGGSSLLTLRGRLRGMHWPLGRLSSGFVNGHQRLDAAVLDGVSQSALLVQCSLSGTRQLVFQIDGSWPA